MSVDYVAAVSKTRDIVKKMVKSLPANNALFDPGFELAEKCGELAASLAAGKVPDAATAVTELNARFQDFAEALSSVSRPPATGDPLATNQRLVNIEERRSKPWLDAVCVHKEDREFVLAHETADRLKSRFQALAQQEKLAPELAMLGHYLLYGDDKDRLLLMSWMLERPWTEVVRHHNYLVVDKRVDQLVVLHEFGTVLSSLELPLFPPGEEFATPAGNVLREHKARCASNPQGGGPGQPPPQPLPPTLTGYGTTGAFFKRQAPTLLKVLDPTVEGGACLIPIVAVPGSDGQFAADATEIEKAFGRELRKADSRDRRLESLERAVEQLRRASPQRKATPVRERTPTPTRPNQGGSPRRRGKAAGDKSS
jgi:hypothetical protein